jgi:phage terminase large subunit
MAYKKPSERTPAEWAAYANWAKNPVEAVKDWFKVTPDDWQGDVLNGLFRGTFDRVAAKAAHGPGKTAVDAWAALIFLNCYKDSRVVATAPTFAQLHDVLFPEIARWHSRMNSRMADEWAISGGHIRHKFNPNVWFGVARTSNKPANLQGFHGQDILILADEASAIPPNVFEVIEGALSEAGEDGKTAKLLMAGNPNFNAGELFDAFNKNRELYERFTITGDVRLLKALGIEQGEVSRDHGRVYYSKRVKPKYCDNIAKKYGIDSAVYDVRVRGIFPRNADDTVIPLEWAERAQLLDVPSYDARADMVTLVCDPSRGGAAETVIGRFRKGVCYKLEAYKTTSTTKIIDLMDEAAKSIKADGLKLLEMIVDEPGIGGGVIDGLRAIGYGVRGYDGGKPMVKGVDPEDECRMFANKRARDWWHLRRALEQNKLPLPTDEVMVNQLASLKFTYNGQEKIVVESKQDLKDRLGPEASPDRGDVIVMGTCPWYTAAAVHAVLTDDDVDGGDDRPTSLYADDMADGLV